MYNFIRAVASLVKLSNQKFRSRIRHTGVGKVMEDPGATQPLQLEEEEEDVSGTPVHRLGVKMARLSQRLNWDGGGGGGGGGGGPGGPFAILCNQYFGDQQHHS